MKMEGPAPRTTAVPLWILSLFLTGGLTAGTFAALAGNWFDVGLSAILAGGALIGLREHRTRRP